MPSTGEHVTMQKATHLFAGLSVWAGITAADPGEDPFLVIESVPWWHSFNGSGAAVSRKPHAMVIWKDRRRTTP